MELKPNQDEVLIATDGSLSSQIASTMACQLAQYKHMKVKGLFVVNEHYVFDRYSDFQAELGEVDAPTSRAELVDLLKLKGKLSLEWLEKLCHAMDLPFEYEIVFGSVVEEVARQSENAKLLAFGKKGYHEPEDLSHLGENFCQFIHRVQAPFIAGDNALRPIRNILLWYNGNQLAERALVWTATLVEAFQANIFVATVMEKHPNQGKEQSLKDKMRKGPLTSYELIALEGDPVDQLAKVAAQKDVDLLIFERYQPSPTFHWLRSNPLDRVLQNIRLTTLVA